MSISLPIDDEGRMKALDAALSDLTKRYGDGTIVRLGDASHMAVDTIPSGSLPAWTSAWGLVVFRVGVLLRFMNRRVPVKPPSACM